MMVQVGHRLYLIGILLLGIQIPLGGIRVALSDFAVVLALAVYFLSSMRVRMWTLSGWVYMVLLVAVIEIGVLRAAVFYGLYSSYAIVNKGVGVLMLFAYAASAYAYIARGGGIRGLFKASVMGVFIGAFVSLLDLWSVISIPSVNWGYGASKRAAGFLVDPNAFGGYVTFGVVLCLYLVSTSSRVYKVWWICVLMVSGLSLIFSFSRSAWLGASCAIVVLSVVHIRKVAPFLLVLGVFAFAVIDWMGVGEELLVKATRINSIDYRMDLNAMAINNFANKPIMGIGVGMTTTESEHIVHNTPLWLLSETGLIGFIVFWLMYVQVLRVFYKSWRRFGSGSEWLVYVGAVHVAMLGLSMGLEALYQRYWWVVMGIGIYAHRLRFGRN